MTAQPASQRPPSPERAEAALSALDFPNDEDRLLECVADETAELGLSRAHCGSEAVKVGKGRSTRWHAACDRGEETIHDRFRQGHRDR